MNGNAPSADPAAPGRSVPSIRSPLSAQLAMSAWYVALPVVPVVFAAGLLPVGPARQAVHVDHQPLATPALVAHPQPAQRQFADCLAHHRLIGLPAQRLQQP